MKYTTEEIYHIFNRNLSGLKTFKKKCDSMRFLELIIYYQYRITPCPFSHLNRQAVKLNYNLRDYVHETVADNDKLVEIIAYCIMPNHFHLLLKQKTDNGISIYLNNVLNGFTRYYNIKNDRKGPIWIGRSKNVHVNSDEQLWQVSRYIHLNPVEANLVRRPDEWVNSSYSEYIGDIPEEDHLCNKALFFDSDPSEYIQFVKNNPTDAVGN